jgi:hypothetical protein
MVFNDLVIIAKKQKDERKLKRVDSKRVISSLCPPGSSMDSECSYIVKENEPLSQCKTISPINDGIFFFSSSSSYSCASSLK